MMLTLLALTAITAADPELVDVSDFRANLRVYSDGHGHNVAVWPGEEMHAFYGDGHTFYELGVIASSRTSEGFETSFSDPRYGREVYDANINSDDRAKIDVYCGKRKTTLPLMDKAAYKAMTAKAVFKRSPWALRAYALARDDKGIYYYVDHGRFDNTTQAFHVYVGPRGNLKEEKLKNVVHDTAGDIFATADGNLRLIVGEKPESEWINNEQHTKLTPLSVDDNGSLIWNDLGVYKHVRYGTPCDDL